jgi:hypothetical protein
MLERYELTLQETEEYMLQYDRPSVVVMDMIKRQGRELTAAGARKELYRRMELIDIERQKLASDQRVIMLALWKVELQGYNALVQLLRD